jgi:hypothetical protein
VYQWDEWSAWPRPRVSFFTLDRRGTRPRAAAEREIAAEKPHAATGIAGRRLARSVPARRLRHHRHYRDVPQGAVRRISAMGGGLG